MEQNKNLQDKFNGLLDDKYDLMLEISAFQKGEVFVRNENGMKEEEDDAVIPEYDPQEQWIVKFSSVARENVALLKRNRELEEEIQELKEGRNRLAAQIEYRSSLSGGKKMKRVPQDVPIDPTEGNRETEQELFRRIVEIGQGPRQGVEGNGNRNRSGTHSEGENKMSLFKSK